MEESSMFVHSLPLWVRSFSFTGSTLRRSLGWAPDKSQSNDHTRPLVVTACTSSRPQVTHSTSGALRDDLGEPRQNGGHLFSNVWGSLVHTNKYPKDILTMSRVIAKLHLVPTKTFGAHRFPCTQYSVKSTGTLTARTDPTITLHITQPHNI